MKAPAFDYHCPQSLDEALALMAEYGADARILAGGQSLLQQLNMRMIQPAHIVDINRIRALQTMNIAHGWLNLGATARQHDVESSPVVQKQFGYLHEALALIASTPIKHRGTVVGSVAHADPAAELPAVSLCHGAAVSAVSAARGERIISADELFIDRFENALAADEICRDIRFPALGAGQAAAIEETQRRYNGIAIAGAAVRVQVRDHCIASARIVNFGVAETPILAAAAQALNGIACDDHQAIAAVASEAAASATSLSDVLASAAYRQHAAAVLTRRALKSAIARAETEVST